MTGVISPEVLGRTLAEAPDPELARVQLSRVGEHPAAREALQRPEVLPNALRLLGFSRAAADFLVELLREVHQQRIPGGEPAHCLAQRAVQHRNDFQQMMGQLVARALRRAEPVPPSRREIRRSPALSVAAIQDLLQPGQVARRRSGGLDQRQQLVLESPPGPGVGVAAEKLLA